MILWASLPLLSGDTARTAKDVGNLVDSLTYMDDILPSWPQREHEGSPPNPGRGPVKALAENQLYKVLVSQAHHRPLAGYPSYS